MARRDTAPSERNQARTSASCSASVESDQLTDKADLSTEVTVLGVLHVGVDKTDDGSYCVTTEGADCESLVPQGLGRELGADGPRDARPRLGEGGKPEEDWRRKIVCQMNVWEGVSAQTTHDSEGVPLESAEGKVNSLKATHALARAPVGEGVTVVMPARAIKAPAMTAPPPTSKKRRPKKS